VYSKCTYAYLYNPIYCGSYQSNVINYIDIHYLNTMPNSYYNMFYTYLQCSVHSASSLPIYSLHPTYTTYTCFIACPYTTLCIACPYTIIIYLPKYSPYTPYKLKIKHLQLHKHCPCRTVVVGTPPRPQGGGG
jgi:hypothetical protein